MSYTPPELAPHCPCYSGRSRMQSFICQYGHLTECHYPLDCDQASCNHLWKYHEDMTQQKMDQRRELTLALLKAHAQPHCTECQGQGVIKLPHTIQSPHFRPLTGEDNITFQLDAVCTCVSNSSTGQAEAAQVPANSTFTQKDGQRLKQLQQLMADGHASDDEIAELRKLAEKWQDTYTRHLLDSREEKP